MFVPVKSTEVLTVVPDVATGRAFLGTALHAPVRGQLEVLCGALIVVGSDGRISAVHRGDSPDAGLPGGNLHFDHCARINIREVWVANRRIHALETSQIRH
jgi:hypothetical protein